MESQLNSLKIFWSSSASVVTQESSTLLVSYFWKWKKKRAQEYSCNITSDLANLHFYWKQLFLLKHKKSVKSVLTIQTSDLKIKPDSKRNNYYVLRSIAFWWECFTNDAIIKIKNHPEKSSGEIFRLWFWSFSWKTEIYSQIFISQYLMSVWYIRLITNLTKFVTFFTSFV